MPFHARPPTPDSQPFLLRARAVVPVVQPPIHDGAILVSRGRIAGVGRWRDLAHSPRKRTMDLGEVIVLPGLVNAHCHLDYTHMAGQFLPPRVFTDWLKLITTAKAVWTQAEYAQSWRQGAEMLARTGTTTVADVEAVSQLLPEVWSATPLRVVSFLEMRGITNRRAPGDVLAEAVEQIASLRSPRCRAGLSPHAPYSTGPELLRLSARTARRRKWPLTVHVAESALEFEMFARGGGEMFDWLERSARDMSDCGLGSPVEHLARCGVLGENLLAIHVNYLGKKDAALLAKGRVSVIHCPRSHAYFDHDPFPLRKLSHAGVNICLGTDSLASVRQARRQTVELNMFEEMRALAARQPGLATKRILAMATINGAHALGMAGAVGELSMGACADLIGIPFTGKMGDVCGSILHDSGDVMCSMIGGKWVVAPRAMNCRHE